jgi:short subunit dehydrogenase-like uncharacterized protein
MKNRLLIYGCNGYTGKLITEIAVKNGLNPVLSGRNEQAVKSIAEHLKCEYRTFDLAGDFSSQLSDIKTVLHCAGPFMYTATAMAKTCIATNTHYLDITGEISVFETLKRLDEKAKAANVTVMPGVGFDVVPTDCLSLYLKEQLPDATSLELCLMNKGGMLSHGTTITVIENLGEGSAIRSKGKIVNTKSGSHTREIDYGTTKKLAVEIPWGDVSTAHFTTGIPNIRVYNVLPMSLIKNMKRSNYLGFILKQRWVKDYLIKKVKQRPAGPDEQMRKEAQSFIWGEVKNDKGETKRATLTLPEGYLLTALTAVKIAGETLKESYSSVGYKTPASVFGADFILQFEGTKRNNLA